MTENFSTPQFKAEFFKPQYWGIWLVLLLIVPLVLLPMSLQRQLGRGLGMLFWCFGRRRRSDTTINLALCFPELDPQQRKQMNKEVFQHAGIGVFESLAAWLRPTIFNKKIHISGIQHILHAQEQDRTVLVMGAHYTMLDLGALLCSRFLRADIIYRPQNNAFLEWIIFTARKPMMNQQIDHHDMRTLIKALKNQHIVWYTPDQDFGLNHGVMAPFFGVPAATITAQRRLAKIGDAVVVAIGFYREDAKHWWQAPTYHIHVTAPLENYPSSDEVVDATRVNLLLESLIRMAPAQYMWFHRRFKTRPASLPSVYPEK